MRRRRSRRAVETVVFNSRWLMTPFYLGLIVGLAVLLFKFAITLYEFITHAWTASESAVIVGVLSLIDFALVGNLILIVVFSSYENFVARIEPGSHPDWPEWMGKIDFSGLKQKLLASIVAISAIELLKEFMNIGAAPDTMKLAWLVGIQLVFVMSTLLLAWSDRHEGRAAD
jgi:uncharacterized protein (TIGR00645 family)